MKFNHLAVASIIGAFTISSHASVLIKEGFDYGLADGTTMNGVATNATGLSGNYALGQSLAGFGSADFTNTGLSFGSSFFPATGGALSMSITSNILNTTRSAQLGAALNTGTVTGTIYTSYLFSLVSTGSLAGTSQMRINGAQTTSSNTRLSVLADGSLTASNSLQYGGESVKNGTSGILSLGTTYLALAKFTELGTVGSTGTGEMWVFTQEGYQDWLTFGLGQEAELMFYAVAGSVLNTSSTTTANNATFGNSQFLSYAVSNASNVNAQAMIIDETRWGTELADVVAIPEPSSILLLSAGALLLLGRQLKRRTV
jgi:hypothetical protein